MEKVSTPVDRHCDRKRTSKRIPAETENLAGSPAHRAEPATFADINRLPRPTLTLNHADELLQFALVEVGDGPERHPCSRPLEHMKTLSCCLLGSGFVAG